jgi:hypothetical protein
MCHFLSTPRCFYPKVIKFTSIGAQVEVPKISLVNLIFENQGSTKTLRTYENMAQL